MCRMDRENSTPGCTKGSWLLLPLLIVILLCACAPERTKPFDPAMCMQTVPPHVNGLEIIQGPRTGRSIIRDMVPVVCNSRVLFARMQSRDPLLQPGKAIFNVTVEYTGEVQRVTMVQTTLQSPVFIQKVSDMIMNTDFVGWARDDADSVFVYPFRFGDD